MTGNLLISIAALCVGQTPPPPGSISGVVVNVTQGDVPVAGAEVALRVKLDGEFVVAGEVLSDENGRFRFDNIPADTSYVYLPGASWQTVHYPGERVQLSALHRSAEVQLGVRDTVQTPTPLVVRRHRVAIESTDEALRITETMDIENPSRSTYVGQPSKPGARAATLQLSIPMDFEKVTFHDEFLGPRFVIIDDRLLTDIPWTPGRRQVKFTYILPNDRAHHVWQRTLDLPTDDLTILVQTGEGNQEQVTGSLHRTIEDGKRFTTFSGEELPAGEVVHIELGHLSAPWTAYAPWIAVGVLLLVIAGTVVYQRRAARRGENRGRNAVPSNSRPRRKAA